MRCHNRKSNLVTYVVAANQDGLNQRIEGVLLLREICEKMVLITNKGSRTDKNNVVIKPYLNPFGIFRLLGLNSFKKKIEKYFLFPSRNILYVIPGVIKLSKLIKNDLKQGKKVSLINCLPPHDIALIGLALKKKFKDIRWIIDWQDLWSYDDYYFERIPKLYRKRFLKIEKQLFQKCDLNVTTSLKAKEVLENTYKIPSHQVKSIPHHYHSLDVTAINQVIQKESESSLNNQINIGFLGNMFKPPKMPGERVADAIRSVNKAGMEVTLHIYGDSSQLAKNAAKQCLNEEIILHKGTSHHESIRNITKCDFLLLSMSELPNCKVVMNIKLPFYMVTGLPVIALVPEASAVADIVRKTGIGYVIPSTKTWGNELQKLLKNHIAGKNIPERDDDEIKKYAWENVSHMWADAIVSCN